MKNVLELLEVDSVLAIAPSDLNPIWRADMVAAGFRKQEVLSPHRILEHLPDGNARPFSPSRGVEFIPLGNAILELQLRGVLHPRIDSFQLPRAYPSAPVKFR